MRHMDAVDEYRQALQNLQTVWDSLTLLGQLAGTSTDMSETRQAFNDLTDVLLNQLGSETLKKCLVEMRAKAQVSIDVLVRNLFERTADIGFLATDEDIRKFITKAAETATTSPDQAGGVSRRAELTARFAEYVAKYSVYFDIILVDLEGTVLARLDDTVQVRRTAGAMVNMALTAMGSYVETYGHFDLLPDVTSALVFSSRVNDDNGAAIGVLCLCFRFENEMERIFGNLATSNDWSVIMLLDAGGTVIASSDAFHVPLGARVEMVLDDEYRIVRFAGREYLATTCATNGYQGYMGPGWYGHVMLPVQHAFNKDASDMLRDIDGMVLGTVMDNPALFDDALRTIPLQASHIQRALNRSVWNGNVRRSSAQTDLNPSFSKILLREISNTGSRTKDVFARSIANLHETVVSSILQDCRFLASLAIDIMDRNLYERANDCRWWALTSAFREILAAPEMATGGAEHMTRLLQTINGLYTVYSNLIVTDSQGCVRAASRPAESALVGTYIREDWLKRVMALPDSQGYAVSRFAATPLYDGRHTYIYGAAIRAPHGDRVVGGVSIIFDSEPQFAAMLQDTLPRDGSGHISPGCFGAFVDQAGQIVASTHRDYRPGARLAVDPAFLCLAKGAMRAGIMELEGSYYAVGARMSAGYREYKNDGDAYVNEIIALVFIPLCEAVGRVPLADIPGFEISSGHAADGERLGIATFHVGHKWYGLRSVHVVEAVDHAGVIRVPGAGGDIVGFLNYEGEPITVFDLRVIVNAPPSREDTRRQIIVLKGTANTRYGILVDGLGEILEIAASRLRPLSGLLSTPDLMAEAIVSSGPPSNEDLLVVLSAEWIAKWAAGSR
jgi:chemotaxis signal transduction protein